MERRKGGELRDRCCKDGWHHGTFESVCDWVCQASNYGLIREAALSVLSTIGIGNLSLCQPVTADDGQ
jgi:hypothetical protein